MSTFYRLAEYRASIEAFNVGRPDMDGVRAYNHQMIDILGKLRPLAGVSLLDVGASPHGYAMERALQLGVSRYVGVGLGVPETIEVTGDTGHGQLLHMNAEQLALPSTSFDLILSLSTFEHFFNGELVLREMYRVLRRGGAALISFQPIWTCSEGHHLHHIPSISALIPAWGHLLLSPSALRSQLAKQWSPTLPMSLDAVINWIYESPEINRVDIITLRDMFRQSPFYIEWLTPLLDEVDDTMRTIVTYLSRLLPYTSDELQTRGFSLFLTKR